MMKEENTYKYASIQELWLVLWKCYYTKDTLRATWAWLYSPILLPLLFVLLYLSLTKTHT